MKNHLKRIPAPKSWAIDRRTATFVIRPTSSGHSFDKGLPLGVVLRDILKMASTRNEAQKLLHHQEVLVDGIRRRDHHYFVGLFDTITFPALKKSFKVVFDVKGRITIEETHFTGLKVCKIVRKMAVPGGKIQYTFHDGKNICSDKAIPVGASVVVSVPDLVVKEVLDLKPGAHVFLVQGKYRGSFGTLKEINGKGAVYESQGQMIETASPYLFVVKELPKIKHQEKKQEKKNRD